MNPRFGTLTATAVLSAAFVLFAPPIHQDQNYHLFADRRTLLGIPNFWNVISNLPFALVGIRGLWASRNAGSRVLFAGVLLTAFGSGYYHWRPNDTTLVWDRLPMTMVFMPLLAAAIGKWIGPRWERGLLAPLLVFGIGIVIWWHVTGDLRPYAAAQFGPILVLLAAVFTDPSVRPLWPVVLWYALAKIAEACDDRIYSVFPLSGHTLKHIAAGLAACWILRWLCVSTASATPLPNTTPPTCMTPAAG